MHGEWSGTHDVFLSYSTKDKKWADAACNVLERNRVRCWIAPRDIIAGEEWGASIIKGLKGSRIMVLIFSGHANASAQVRREVERAISQGMTVLPVRIEDVRPDGAMEYALSNTHWLDAFAPPVERQLEKLARSVKTLLGDEGESVAEPEPAEPAAIPSPPLGRNGLWIWSGIGALTVLACAGIIIYVGSQQGAGTVAGPNLKAANQGGNKKAAFPSPKVRDRSRLDFAKARLQAPIRKAAGPQLESLLVQGSVWKGRFTYDNGTKGQIELYVEARAGRTFKGIHVGRFDNGKPNRAIVWVDGTVREDVLSYHTQPPGAPFVLTGSLKGDLLDVSYTGPGKAELKKEADKPASGRVVFGVFQKDDPDGWKLLNQDGSSDGTEPPAVVHDGFQYRLVAWPKRSPKEFSWQAPAKFHGDHSGKYGKWLIYTLFAPDVGQPPSSDWCIWLQGGGMILYLDVTDQPPPGKNAWKTYCLRLDASGGWKRSDTQKRATDEEIRSVLAAVTDLRIRGEFDKKAGGNLWGLEFGADDPFKN
jgi:hypothetical protein